MPRKCSPTCPLQPYLHEDTLEAPTSGMVLHVGTGQLLAIARGRISAVAYHPSEGQGASCYRVELADLSHGLVDPSVLASGHLLTHPDGRGRRTGEQMRWVCACVRPSPCGKEPGPPIWGGGLPE